MSCGNIIIEMEKMRAPWLMDLAFEQTTLVG
jgi:hypothetical protein